MKSYWVKLKRILILVAAFHCLKAAPCYGFIKEFAMADAGVAYPQSATTARYNPAGIIEVANRFDVGAGIIYINGHAKISDSLVPTFNQTSSTTQCKWIPAFLFGITKSVAQNVVIGFSTDVGITSSKGTVRHGLNAYGQDHLGAESIISALVPTVAYRWGCHDFGLSVPLNISRIKFNGLQNFIPLSIHPHHVTNQGYDWSYALNLRLGWLFHINERLSFGISYFTKQLCSSHFKKYRGLTPSRGKYEVPPELRVGLSYNFCKATISLQGTLFNFQSCRTLSNAVDAQAPLGSKKGPGGGLKDAFSLNIGVDYQVVETFCIRGGYAHYFSPIILKSNLLVGFLRPNIFSKDIWTVGFTQKYCGFDIDFMCAVGKRREVTKKNAFAQVGGNLRADGSIMVFLFGLGREF